MINKFKEYREQIGMTKSELSKKIGMSVSYITELEENKHPKMHTNTFIKVACGLDVDINDWRKLFE